VRVLAWMTALLAAVPMPAWAAEQEGVNVMPTDIGLWVWTLATFLVMFGLLTKVAFKPIGEALDRRAKAVQQHLDDAQKEREEARKMMADYEKQISDARGEAAKIIEEARSLGDEMRKDVVEKAKAEARAAIEHARDEIERQKQKSIQDLKDTVAALSVQIASKVIEKEIDEASHRKLVDDLIRDLGRNRGVS
jgi:F-type H+-transporting ATPase subunit b